MSKVTSLILFSWIALVAGAFYFHSNQPSVLGGSMQSLASVSVLWAYAFYLLLGCVRGFTLMPLTILVGFGMLFLKPVPLFILSMLGTLVSSAAIYHFASVFKLYERFERNHQKHVDSLERGMKKYELPIIVGWSFFPLLPTDVVCYVSGIMRLSLTKLLIGMLIGEGVCCALYIFGGIELAQFFALGK
ncbi:MAG: VTT domain-containing protein [Bryobacteraceae bacterium]